MSEKLEAEKKWVFLFTIEVNLVQLKLHEQGWKNFMGLGWKIWEGPDYAGSLWTMVRTLILFQDNWEATGMFQVGKKHDRSVS